MKVLPAPTASRVAVYVLFFAAMSANTQAQKKIQCTDGEHIEIDIKRIAIEYDASTFAGTLSSLSVLGARMETRPTKLQEAAAATQQWDVFLKGLAEGYNKCAVSRQQYTEGLQHIYPRLKEDAVGLEEIRKAISSGQQAEVKQLQSLLDSYYANLRRFAQIGGKEIILEKIEALSDQIAGGHKKILEQQKTDTELILAKLNELEARNTQAPLSTPKEVGSQLSEIKQSLLAKSDEAEAAYNKGFELFQRYRFREAVPFLQQALSAVPLPDFYLALGRAYEELPDPAQAENILRKGLTVAKERGNKRRDESAIAGQLGLVLLQKGDLEGALNYAQRSLKIDENVYGPDHPEVAVRSTNIGVILLEKGDLDGALDYTQRALKIDERFYGSDHPNVALCANNIGQILKEKGNLNEALTYTRRALEIDEKLYGPDHPEVARDANNIGEILHSKGDLDGALGYVQRALKIDEKVYGPDHPIVAIDANNIGQIFKDKGDLDGALIYAQHALENAEKVYGPDHPTVATRANNIGQILQAKRDLDGALTYTQRALKIEEKVYGPDHPKVAVCASNIGTILLDKRDLDGALSYAQRALKIDEKVYGPDHPNVGIDAGNIGQILKAKGDMVGALSYTQRALKIDEKVYGPDHPTVAIDANNIGQILGAKGEWDRALSYTQRALKILENSYGPDNPTTRRIAANLERIKQLRTKQ
jgi:tetratricopeptide (TPR) repeat protein